MAPLKFFILNGPNLNLLGAREPEVYGRTTLAEIDKSAADRAGKLGVEVVCAQSNHEGEIVDLIHRAGAEADGIIINPGALTHYSYSLHDAIKSVSIPTIEVHLSNIHAREPFRRNSVTGAAAAGIISGFGPHGYILAIDALCSRLKSRERS